jgi:hypothetical protein
MLIGRALPAAMTPAEYGWEARQLRPQQPSVGGDASGLRRTPHGWYDASITPDQGSEGLQVLDDG